MPSSDNSPHRLHDVFFYGLYMVPEILAERGVAMRNPRRGRVEGYTLRIGKRATLLRADGGTAHGMVYALTHAEIHALYAGAGLTDYAAEAVAVQVGTQVLPALCCNLIVAPAEDESNPEYAARLKTAMEKLGLPWHAG
jgi:hypothetical protein